jgi:cell division GTPase FtsZ
MSALPGSSRPRFGLPGRIQAPNAKPRSIALVGLGEGGGRVAEHIRDDGPHDLQLRIFPTPRPPEPDALASIKSNGDDLHRALQEADMIFVVARPGDDVRLVPVVSRLAGERHAQVSALYLVPPGHDADTHDDATLRTLRTGVPMLVVASDESYVAAMIAALGS